MNEASKTRRLWTEREWSLLKGEGIDIGCGPDPVSADAMPFDQAQGDANHITRYVVRQFDYVFSSHCLEHMHDPRAAILEWWKLVKPGGVLFVVVPDEDLYEQGVFPSISNPDHKATFTLSKRKSWSPRSINVLDLALGLPGGDLVCLELQDEGYDRTLLRFAGRPGRPLWQRGVRWLYYRAKGLVGLNLPRLEAVFLQWPPCDQTMVRDAVAQIQLIVRKNAE